MTIIEFVSDGVYPLSRLLVGMGHGRALAQFLSCSLEQTINVSMLAPRTGGSLHVLEAKARSTNFLVFFPPSIDLLQGLGHATVNGSGIDQIRKDYRADLDRRSSPASRRVAGGNLQLLRPF